MHRLVVYLFNWFLLAKIMVGPLYKKKILTATAAALITGNSNPPLSLPKQ